MTIKHTTSYLPRALTDELHREWLAPTEAKTRYAEAAQRAESLYNVARTLYEDLRRGNPPGIAPEELDSVAAVIEAVDAHRDRVMALQSNQRASLDPMDSNA